MMKNMKKAGLLTLIALSLSACESLNSSLASINSVLGTVNSTLSGMNNSQTSSQSTSDNIAPIDRATISSIESSLNKATAPNDAKALFASAKPTINKMLQRAACGASGKDMEIFAAPPTNSQIYMGALWHMQHHQSGCAHVVRVNNIKKEAANAISFAVLYMSPQSEETNVRNYTAIRQDDGEWLFRWIVS